MPPLSLFFSSCFCQYTEVLGEVFSTSDNPTFVTSRLRATATCYWVLGLLLTTFSSFKLLRMH